MANDDPTIAETPRSAARRKLTEPPERYDIQQLLGEGGMGRVYRAHDNKLGRDVAIKMLDRELQGPDKTQQKERFVREARAAARLLHPHIAVVHDVDAEAGWLVMELVEGESLRDVAARGSLAPPHVRRVAEQVLSALDAAHAAGIIHRDVKPSNIVQTPSGNVKLVDFGVARLVDVEVTRTGESIGTPAYMAPEQVRGGAVDARTDLYALGATLYELVTGNRMVAFESPGATAVAKIRDACGDDTQLASAICRLLQADPDARFPSARDALAALARTPPRAGTWKRIILAAVIAAALAGAVVAVVARTRSSDSTEDPRLARAFKLAQRGENEKASGVLEELLAEHPRHPDAVTYKVLVDWWQGGLIVDIDKRLADVKLRPPQRAMAHGIDLITARRETEAIAYLEAKNREHPDQVEILYALGEAQWHGQQLEAGVATLERAFLRDPRWQVALHHVAEYRLSRGETSKLEAVATALRASDPPAGAALDCKIAFANREYGRAAEIAARALERVEKIPELYLCLAQAQILGKKWEAATTTAKAAFDLWPIDLREWGGFAQYAELLLYQGKLDEYLDLLRKKPSRQRALALLLWRPTTETNETQPAGPGMRMPPLGAATWILQESQRDRDTVGIYGDYPEPEVREWGYGLWAEKKGDTAAAIAHYKQALATPAKGDMRMLLSHALARVLHATGDAAGARAACEDVLAPRVYETYRALLVPDCLVWSGRGKELLDTWRGFDHPAVVEARDQQQ